jgi:hypothetical protein
MHTFLAPLQKVNSFSEKVNEEEFYRMFKPSADLIQIIFSGNLAFRFGSLSVH